MSQQMKNGSEHKGDITLTNRDTYRYAVVNPPFEGKHRKPQDEKALEKRKFNWRMRNLALVERGKK